jgi:hypothetical protein
MAVYPILLASLALTALTAAFAVMLYARRLGAQRRRRADEAALALAEPIALDLLGGGDLTEVPPSSNQPSRGRSAGWRRW